MAPCKKGAWRNCTAFLSGAIQLVALFGTVTAEGPQISNLNLLLPPRATNPVRYRLQGSHGCFDWSVDHNDLLDIEPEYNSTVPGCSTSVTITSKAAYSGRRTTAVHARDQKSGRVLRCEVVLDKISKIAIFHTVLKIDLEGLATLQIRAFDAEDNLFSSLIGLQFAWTFTPLGADATVHKLRHVPLKETALSGCGCDCGDVWVRIEIEEGELWSDLFVVKGVEPGKEQVSAQLVEPGFPALEHSVALTVAEAFSLLPPSPVHIIPGTRLEYTIVTYRPDRPEGTLVSLPSPFYKWSIDNATVASIHPETGHVLAHTLGAAHVTVTDTRVEDHFQTSLLKVVVPTRLVLSLRPLDLDGVNGGLSRSVSSRALQGKKSDGTWQIVEGRRYVVQVAAFSKDSGKQPLVLTHDVDLRLSFDNIPAWITRPVSESEAVKSGWANATVLEALQEGSGTLSAALIFGNMVKDGVSGDWGKGPQSVLEAEQEVRVCTPVRVGRDALRLPWLPRGAQGYTLRATGGCDLGYNWFSEDPSVATVDPSGTVHAVGPGQTRVFAAAAFDELNVASTAVRVTVPASLQHVQSLPVDVQVGEVAPAAVKLLDSDGHEYDNCTAAARFVSWHVTPTKPFQQGDLTPTPSPLSSTPLSDSAAPEKLRKAQSAVPADACASHVWWAVRPGLVRVTAVLDFEGGSELRRAAQERAASEGRTLSEQEELGSTGGLEYKGVGGAAVPKKLAAEWTMAVFSPLVLERADNGTGVGGYTVAEHEVVDEVKLVPGSSVKVRTRGGPEKRGLEEFAEGARVLGEGVAVKQLGRSDAPGGRTYEVTCTEPGSKSISFLKGIAQANLTVHCEVLAAITLLIDEAVNSQSAIRTFAGLERDSNHIHTLTHQVINNRLIRVAAVALDPELNPFATAESLTVDWALEDCEGAQWASLAGEDLGLESGLSSNWERGLLLGDRSGKCIVRAMVVGLDHNQAKAKDVPRQVVSDVEDEIRKKTEKLTDGATLQLVSALRLEPQFALLFNHPAARVTLRVLGGTSDIQALSNDSKVAEIVQAPPGKTLQVSPKGLGVAEIMVKDVGLEHPTSASAVVAVSDVAWVKVPTREDLVLQVGSNATVAVEAGDDLGRPFDPSQFPYLNLAVHLSDETVTLADVPTKAPNEFVIQGKSVGTTTFHVSVRSASGRTIESKFVRVSVYAPLSLHPPEIVLAPGADYAIQVQGGPRSSAQVQLSSSDITVVSADPVLGLVRGEKEGQAEVRAQARSASGQVLSEAATTVVVRKLVKAGLHVGTGRLGVGEEMAVFPEGGERGEDLMSFGQVCYGYRWSVGDAEVLQVQRGEALEVPESRGGDPLAELEPGFSVRLAGRTPGRTTVSLTFKCRYGPPGTPPVNYNASANILVVDDIPVNRGCCATWLLPPHYETSFNLPYFECCGPETTMYSILQSCPPPNQDNNYVVKLVDEGRLQTGSRPDVECIHARVRSTGRAGLAACVRVAEIAELTVGDDTFPWHSAELSVGATQAFTVTPRDEFGSPFFETARIALHVEANHPEIVAVHVDSQLASEGEIQVTRTQVLVKALKQGTALVRVHLASAPDIADFLLVRVGAYVSPREPVVHLGSRIGFTAGLGGSAGGLREEGRWSSGDAGVVRIDPFSGEATAVGPGTTTVHFNSSRLTTYTTVTVIPVAAVSVKQPQDVPFLTNARADAEYRFPLVFRDVNGHDLNPPAIAAVAPYECQLSPSYLGHAHAWQNETSGEAFCVIHTEDPESIALSRADAQQPVADRTGSVRGTLRADVPAVGEVPAVAGQQEQFRFVGAFALASGTPPELYLYKSSNRTIVSLVGNAADVIVSWGHRDAVLIRRVSRGEEAAGLSGRALYEIKLLQPGSSLSDKAVFTSQNTGQSVELPFHYDAGGTPVLGYTLLAAILATVFALLAASIRSLWTAFVRRRPPPPPPPAAVAQNPQTPEPPLPAPTVTPAQNGDGPRMRTPTEVREYFERTLERTPGYGTSPLRYTPLNDTY